MKNAMSLLKWVPSFLRLLQEIQEKVVTEQKIAVKM